jgi:hypothetical protein
MSVSIQELDPKLQNAETREMETLLSEKIVG